MQDILDRFIRYVKINTRSDENVTDRTPSTENQWDLARLLEKELKELGMQDVFLNEKCFLTATLPANVQDEVPVIGFLAHMDTSPDFSGAQVKPQIIENYDGGDIPLKGQAGMLLSPREFPSLLKYKGQTLVTTDGTTLLGADDKAGVAEIMSALAHLQAHPEIPHGRIRVAFTPDEETGMGIAHFDVPAFGADFAYTLDAGEVGEIEYENFNAARAQVTIQGRSVHPGDAKGVLLNAMQVFFELNGMLPVEQRPEYTEGREGFFHFWKMYESGVEQASGVYLIRDHDRQKFEHKKRLMLEGAAFLNQKYDSGTVEIKLRDQYYNMREKLEEVFHVVDLAREAIEALGIEPIIMPVRGGTDGSRLSFMGLPCPNIFTGGLYPHGRFECLPTRSMEKAVDVVIKIVELSEKKY